MSIGRRCYPQKGFTYVFALVFTALAGVSAAAIAETWSHARQREKEVELHWVGEQIRRAIGIYYQRSPGAAKRYPTSLDELLEDRRFLTTQRYLRRIYEDPLTGKPDWELIAAPAGGIMGVRSQATSKAMSIRAQQAFVYEPR